MQRFSARLSGLDPREREAVEALTKGILGKLLHEPTVQLKEAAGTPRAERLGDAVRTLFDLSERL
jgi:glutamyl-tRNA reductase